MRKFLAIIILLLACADFGYAQGVVLFNKEVNDDIYAALDAVKRERKILMVEFFAPWNYKSKWVNEMINSSEEIAKELDKNFIVFQFDTSTTKGADFANRYQATNYPYILFFNRNGDVIYKIDKSMDADDFIETLNTVLIQQNGSTVWKISQLDTAIANMDFETANSIFNQLHTTIKDDIFKKHYWRFFENDLVTQYGSSAYSLLSENINKFEVNSSVVKERVCNILRDLITPYLIEYKGYDSVAMGVFSDEFNKFGLTDKRSEIIIEMIASRSKNDIWHYLTKCEELLTLMAEDEGISIVLTLDYVVEKGSKEQKAKAQKIVENEISKSPLGSHTDLLEVLLSKF